jgi:hypothetical protein
MQRSDPKNKTKLLKEVRQSIKKSRQALLSLKQSLNILKTDP